MLNLNNASTGRTSVSNSTDSPQREQTFFGNEEKFLRTFGRSQVDYDLLGESGKMATNEDPFPYIFHVLRYVKASSPNATEAEQITWLRLFTEDVNLKDFFGKRPFKPPS